MNGRKRDALKMLQGSYFDALCTLTLGKDVLDPEL